jgi:fibronectin type 3 domain-containing protein
MRMLLGTSSSRMARSEIRFLVLITALALAGSASAQDSWTKIPGLVGGTAQSITSVSDGTYWAASDFGIATSAFAGQSWSDLGTLGDDVRSIVQLGSGGLMATRACQIYQSDDGGSSWSAISPGDSFTTSLCSSSYLSASTGLGAVAAVRGEAAAISFNNGSTWSVRATTDTTFASVRPAILANGDVLFPHSSKGETILKSTNLGASWSYVSTGLFASSTISGIYVASSGRIWLGANESGSAVVLYSDDSGTTWTRSTAPNSSYSVTSFAEFQSDLIAGTSYGGAYRSSDSGGTWSLMNGGPSSSAVTDLHSSSSGALVAVINNSLYRYDTTASSWIRWMDGIEHENVSELLFDNDGTLWAASGDETHQYSGATWTSSFEQESRGLFQRSDGEVIRSTYFNITESPSGKLYGRTLGGLYESSDGGISWTATTTEYSGGYGARIFSFYPDHILMSMTQGVVQSQDGGATWESLLPVGGAGFLAIPLNNEPGLLLTSPRTGTVDLYRSNDGGSSWDAVSGAPELDYITTLPGGAICGSGGVPTVNYCSYDAGLTWEDMNLTGVIQADNRARVGSNIVGGHDNTLYASVVDDGVWTRSIAQAPTDLIPPKAPLELAATQSNQTTISVSWGAAPEVDADGYIVYKGTTSFPTTELTRLPAGTLSLTDQDVSSGQTYYYVVKALDTSGNESGASTQVSVAAQDVTAPAAPTGVSAVATDGSVTVTWAANTEGDVQSYRVFRGTATAPTDLAGAVLFGTETYVDSNVSNGTSYFYRVSAVDQNGNASDLSAEVVATPRDAEPPSAVTNLSAEVDDLVVTISWTASSSTDVVTYQVYRSTSPGASDQLAEVGQTTPSYVDSSVATGNKYYYRVTARDGSGNLSDFSGEVSARVDTQAPAIPASLSASGGDQRVDLAWAANTEPDLASYRIFRGLESPPSALINIVAAGTETFADLGLAQGVTYFYRITAIDSTGNESGFSDEASASTDELDLQAPAAPTSLAATGGDERVDLAWATNAESDLASYRVYRGLTPTPTTPVSTVTAGTQILADTGLTQGVTYFYRITAFDNSDNESGFSNEVSATTGDTQAPTIPAGLTASSQDGRVALTWLANSETDLAEYLLLRGTSIDPTTPLTTVAKGTQQFNDTGLTNGITYHYRIRARDTSANLSDFSPSVSATPVTASFTVEMTQAFGPTSTSSAYRLISLPGAGTVEVGSTFSGTSGTDWNVYHDTGTNGSDITDYLTAFNGSSLFNFGPGRGFWAISKTNWEVSGRTSTQVTLDNSGSYGINVQTGWNIIGNPFDFSVSWEEVRQANGLSGDLHAFGGTFRTALNMEPYVGYYWINTGSLSKLQIPYRRSGSKRADKASAFQGVTVRFAVGDQVSAVELGQSASANDGIDTMDRFAPPGFFGVVNAALVVEADGYPYLRRDVRPASSGGRRHDLLLTTENATTVSVSTEGGAAWLVSSDSGRPLFLSRNPVSLQVSEGVRYALVVGDEASARNVSDSFVPNRLELRPPYPNPLQTSSYFEYGLPEARRVTVTIFDMLGRRVVRLVDGRADGGWHRVSWDARDSALRDVAAGVYYISVMARDGSVFSPLVVLR